MTKAMVIPVAGTPFSGDGRAAAHKETSGLCKTWNGLLLYSVMAQFAKVYNYFLFMIRISTH
jgi:hypothetical protein